MLYSLKIESGTFEYQFILWGLFLILGYIIIRYSFKIIETNYALKRKKLLFNHVYFYLRRLNVKQKRILERQFTFYTKLTSKEKKYFEHRVASFIKDKDFLGREDLVVTEEMRVLISATAVMLTFGFRDYFIGLISKIIIYPKVFYSTTNKAYHKGEFNPKLKALVLSWEDFVEGYCNSNDNLNLGIHEVTHAIHLNSLKTSGVSAIVFRDSFNELSKLLYKNEDLRNELKDSNYFRTYAFTNQFEFLAVVIENFIETPQDFKLKFPEVYNKVKQMFNFNFSGY